MLTDAYEDCLKSRAIGPFVLISGLDAVAFVMTPEAVIGSLEALRQAAETAIRNREAGVLVDDTP